MTSTGTIYVIQARTVIMGPNDAICVIWAQGEFFLNLFVFFHYTTPTPERKRPHRLAFVARVRSVGHVGCTE